MLLTPHRRPEAMVFADHQGLRLHDFIVAGNQFGIHEIILAYMDEAEKSGKTITELCEEIATSFEKYPKTTKQVITELGHGDFRVCSDGTFAFEPDVHNGGHGMTIFVYPEKKASHELADDVPRPAQEVEYYSEIYFKPGYSFNSFMYSLDESHIEQIVETEITKISGIDPFTGIVNADGEQFFAVRTDIHIDAKCTAKLDRSPNGDYHVFDVTSKVFGAADTTLSQPTTNREIIFDDGRMFTLKQDAPGYPTQITDGQGNSRYLDVDPARMAHEDIMEALYGGSKVGNDDFCYTTDTNDRMPATPSCNVMESGDSPFAKVNLDEVEIGG